MEKENLPITHSLSVSAPPIEPSGDFQKKSKYATFGGIGARDPSTVAREYLGNVLRDHIPRNIVDLPRLPASTLSSLVAGPTTNSSDIINVPETLAHRPPYPIEVRHPTQSVRDTVIRRNQLRGHGPDSFNNFMEERLIRFTPSISQNNVEDTMTGRHAYQLQEDVGSVIGPSKTWYNSIFRVQSEKLTRQQGSDEDTTAQTERAKDPYHIEENFEEFSVQKILSEFQLKRPVKPSKAKETNDQDTVAVDSHGAPTLEPLGTSTPTVNAPTFNALPITLKDIQELRPDATFRQTTQSAQQDSHELTGWKEFVETLKEVFGCY